MKLLVTGATGFIGSYLCAALVEAGHEVAVLARNLDHWRLSETRDRLLLIRGDLGRPSDWRESVAAFGPEGVAHLAWAGVGGAERNDPLQIANIGWTADLLAAAAGARIFLGVGSQAEYGPKTGVIGPDAETHPTTLYGEAKLATCRIAEKLCAGRGMRFVWIRIFSTYGPGDSPRWLIPGLVGRLLRGERPSLTMGEQRWDFLHARDAASAIRTAIEAPEAHGIFNLGSGSATPLRETIEIVRDQIDPNLDLGWGEVPYRPDQVMHLEADIGRLTALGWKPAIPLRDGLAGCIAWYRDNPWIYETDRAT